MNTLSSLLAVTWFASLWQGAALAVLAALFLRLMPRATAALRHTVLLTVFALAAMLPFLHRSARLAEPHAALTLAPWIASLIAVAWVTASSVRAASLVHAWTHLRRVRAAATPIAVDGVNAFPAGRRKAMLCASNAVDTPAVLGFFKPVLLLPTWMVPTLTPDDLQQIALHECEHLRRRDDWINLLLQTGLLLMPLNPALLWLNRSIATERELACDAAVVAATAKPLAYAASLTRLAEQRMRHHSMQLALAALGRKSELAQRVHALLREPAATWSRRASAGVLAATATLLLAASAGLTQVPGLVQVASAVAPSTTVATHAPQPAPAMTLTPVAYRVPAVAKPRHKTVHRTAPTFVETTPVSETPVRFLRTRVEDSSDVFTQDAVQYNDRPARRITTEFVQPYVAVPVPNGWLLIQL